MPATSPVSSSAWLSEEAFKSACAALPLVSVDWYVCRGKGALRSLLVGERLNRPARGWWFTPGGRVRKNEALHQAQHRVAQEEMGLPLAWCARGQLMGAWDHFYDDSAFSEDVSTHYVNLPYWLEISEEEGQLLDETLAKACEQHRRWQWMPLSEALVSERLHRYVRVTLQSWGPAWSV